jgi:hypothetical protein
LFIISVRRLLSYCDISVNATMAVINDTPQQAAAPQPIDVEAWTEQATAAMGAVAISVPGEVAGSTTVTLAIPLDEHDAMTGGPVQPVGASAAAKEGGYYYKRKEPLRRDSMNRREALLKGKEGSRQRRRWENGMSQQQGAELQSKGELTPG